MKMMFEELRDAVNFTAQQTGFTSLMIEKDYYCSLVLKILYENKELKDILIFKGGTLLSKGYFDFFRMSEDLDFSVGNSFCANRSDRKKVAEIFKTTISSILNELNFREVSPFRGYNESSHYNGIFGYDSVVGMSNSIKFDVGLRGDLILDPVTYNLKTLLKNPISDVQLFDNISALTLSKEEVFAEKFRAALTRKPFAIRDFFDIEMILRSGFDIFNADFIELVKIKIQFDKASNIDLTLEKKKVLQYQIKTDLNPVLAPGREFLLDESWINLQNFVKFL